MVAPPAGAAAGLLSRPDERAFGILLHPTSLPGAGPIGSLGQPARDFVDWLAAAGASWWQTLPLTLPGGGNSPYASPSSLAGNVWLLDEAELVGDGLLTLSELPSTTRQPAPNLVDFAEVHGAKRERLAKAADRLLARPADSPLQRALQQWRLAQPWSMDVAWFLAYRRHVDYVPWWRWPSALRDRDPAALQRVRQRLRRDVDHELVWQFLFDRQWQALRTYATSRGVRFLGDVPMYVDADSADTWCHRRWFQLDPSGAPSQVAGVPPDYFSATGQRWGNPVYDWPAMAANGFGWWKARLQRGLQWSDALRIDHFRGFAAYWSLPAEAPDATTGQWVAGPGRALFDALGRTVTSRLVAEDLGVIDADVVALRDAVGLPGMLVLQFAFGASDSNPFLPHHHVPHALVYPGTHDNDTTAGWWADVAPQLRAHVEQYVGREIADATDAATALRRLALASVARLAVLPVQDVLALPTSARLNVPGLVDGNWAWRLAPGALTSKHALGLRLEARLFDRLQR